MHDLCQLSICSRHQSRCQSRIEIISSVSGVPHHILSVDLEPEVSAIFIFLIHPAEIYRILVHRIDTVRRLFPIFHFWGKKSAVSNRRCTCIQRYLITSILFSDPIDSAKVPLGMFLIPGENASHKIQNTGILFDRHCNFLHRRTIHGLFCRLSRICCHSPEIFLALFYSPAIDRHILQRADTSGRNRNFIPISSKDLLCLSLQEEKALRRFIWKVTVFQFHLKPLIFLIDRQIWKAHRYLFRNLFCL